MSLGVWTEADHEKQHKDVVEEVRAANKEAESFGTLGTNPPSVKTMFEDVYKEMPWHLRRQRQELGV
jgi:2-oxoisovalerate dehydrogenase E1 component alpha subunit